MDTNLTIEEQILQKEKELESLRLINEKEKYLKEGILKMLDNNILKDVVMRDYATPTGRNCVISFKLNDKVFDISIKFDTYELTKMMDLASIKIANVLQKEIFKILVQKSI